VVRWQSVPGVLWMLVGGGGCLVATGVLIGAVQTLGPEEAAVLLGGWAVEQGTLQWLGVLFALLTVLGLGGPHVA